MDGTTQLAIAEVVIYLIMIVLAFILAYKHGKHGLEGWSFFIGFCALRIVAGGMQINNWNKIKKGETVSDTASIINSVGVSVLLLCVCGLIHEASIYECNHNRKLGWIIVGINHLGVTAGIALAAVGGSKLTEATTKDDHHQDQALLLAGYFIILAAMFGELLYAGKTILSLRRSSPIVPSSTIRSAKMLVYGVVAAVIVLFARIIYSIVFGFTLDPSLSLYTGSMVVKVILIFLVQLIAAICVAIAGFAARNICKERHSEASSTEVLDMK